jgi:hypothetical protein
MIVAIVRPAQTATDSVLDLQDFSSTVWPHFTQARGARLFEVLFALAIALAVITLVGHGLWLLMAAIVRAIANTGTPPTQSDQRGAGFIRSGTVLADLLTELSALRNRDEIDPEVYDRLVEAVRAEQRLEVSRVAAPAVSPSTQPPSAPGPAKAESSEARPTMDLDIELPPIEPTRAPEAPIEAEVVDAVVIDEPAEVAISQTLDADARRRAEEFVARRTADVAESEPYTPPTPRKPLAGVLASFMEEKNIRWGELVGGLLIVCSSIALVVSFWSKIADRPLMQFFLFNGVTAGLFGIGYYVHRHWRLATTSQGLFIIATLLVPLNFLAIAALAREATEINALAIVGEGISIVLLGALVLMASRIIVPDAAVPLTLGMMVISVSPLLIRRVIDPASSSLELFGVGMLPVAAYLLPTTWFARKAQDRPELDESTINQIFKLLGLLTFGLLVAMGILLVKSATPALRLRELSTLIALCGAPSLACGLVLWQKLVGTRTAAARTAGTALAVLGAGLMIAAIVLAWPDPGRMATVALIDFVVLTMAAVFYGMPAAHLPAAGAAAWAYAVVVPVVMQRIGWRVTNPQQMLGALLNPESGTALLPLTIVLGGAAGVWAWRKRTTEALCYAVIAGVVAVASLALVTFYGFGYPDDGGALWVYAIDALCALAAARLARKPAIAWFGSALLLAAMLQGIVFKHIGVLGLGHPWLTALLAHAVVDLAIALVARRSCQVSRDTLATPLERSALFTSLVAVPVLVGYVYFGSADAVYGCAFLMAAIWLLLAYLWASPNLFSDFQLGLTAAVGLSVTAALEREPWYAGQARPWLDPWTWQAVGLALMGLSLLWVVIRLVVRYTAIGGDLPRKLVREDRWTVDQHMTAIVGAVAFAMAVYAVVPETLFEISHAGRFLEANVLSIAEIPYTHASGAGAEALVAAVLIVLIGRLREGYRLRLLLAVVAMGAAASALVAAHWVGSTASAVRWSLSNYLLVASVLIWMRGCWTPALRRLGWRASKSKRLEAVPLARAALLAVCVIPVIAITIVAAHRIAQRVALVDVDPASVFGRMSTDTLYVGPLALVVAVLAGHALRERLSRYGLAGGLMLHLSVYVAFLVRRQLPLVHWSWFFPQANAIVGAAYALGWQGVQQLAALRHRKVDADDLSELSAEQHAADLGPTSYQAAQLSITVLCMLVYVGAAGAWLFAEPAGRLALAPAANVWGWLGYLGAMSALAGFAWTYLRSFMPHVAAMKLLVGGTLAAVTITFQTTSLWSGYHFWMLWTAAAAGVMLALGRCYLAARHTAVTGWATVSLIVATVLALRSLVDDPDRPWWCLATLATAAVAWTAVACWSMRRRFIYFAGATINLAATIAWFDWISRVPARSPLSELAWFGDFTFINCLALALPCWIWLAIDRRWLEPFLSTQPRRASIGLHRVAPAFCVAGLALIVFAGLVNVRQVAPSTTLAVLAIVATCSAVLAGLWDRHARNVMPTLYVAGLVTLGVALVQYRVTGDMLVLMATCLAAAYALFTSYLWSRRESLVKLGQRLAVQDIADDPFAGLAWLTPLNSALAIGVITASYLIDFKFVQRDMRLIAANAAVLQTVTFALLAHGRRRTELQFVTLVAGVFGVTAWGLAWLDPHVTHPLLNRLAMVIASLAGMTILYGLGLTKLLRRENAWTRAAERLVPVLVGAGTIGVVVMLGAEVLFQAELRQKPLSYLAILVVAVALGVSFAASLAAALLPGRDPFNLSERGRTAYVYAGEALLGLMFLHIRLTMPWLFRGWFLRYWPLVVMIIAFTGVGLGELFRRRKQNVLAEPLERTGALLPLLPVLGFWFMNTEVHYSMLLVLVGVLYLALAVMRRSFGYSILSALAANGGLWYFLEHVDGWGLLEHPQLWLIPPAVCVLVAAYLNKDRLNEQQMTTLRYLSSSTIYVSSTADIFLNGVAEDPWLPLVLGAISIAGIFAGIVLRVRAFLFLGTAFLSLALMTIIWYAAVDLHQTWLWAVTGIIAGIAIIAVFAVFEKRRDDVVKVLGKLKQWDR